MFLPSIEGTIEEFESKFVGKTPIDNHYTINEVLDWLRSTLEARDRAIVESIINEIPDDSGIKWDEGDWSRDVALNGAEFKSSLRVKYALLPHSEKK